MMNKRVIVIGSYLVALVMETKRIPRQGETLIAKNFRQAHGGKGSNQAVQASRLGARTEFIGFVGNDSYGRSFIDLCKSEKIDTSKIQVSNSLPTGAGFIICTAEGHNIITIDIGANMEMTPDAVDKLSVGILPGDIVLIQLEIPVEPALYAARVAKKMGATVILNPAPAADLSEIDLSYVDFITPNETEARVCCGLDPSKTVSDLEAATTLLALGCKNVIVTLGDQGCMVLNNKGSFKVPAFNFSGIVDSTGAGDSFNAALAVSILEGKPLPEACKFANAAAGLACTKHDTIPSFHLRNEVDEFLHNNQ